MTPIILFPGIPGGLELLVVLLMMAIFLLVPLVLVIGAYLFGKRRGQAESADDEGPERVD